MTGNWIVIQRARSSGMWEVVHSHVENSGRAKELVDHIWNSIDYQNATKPYESWFTDATCLELREICEADESTIEIDLYRPPWRKSDQ